MDLRNSCKVVVLVGLIACGPSVDGTRAPTSPGLSEAPTPPASTPPAPAPTLTPAPAASSSSTRTAAPTVRSLTEVGEPPAGVPAAVYAELFEPNRAWKLSGTTKSGWYEDRPRSSKGTFQATCKVTQVKRLKWGVVSQISCENLPSIPMPDPLTGTWIATPEGLFHPGEEPKDQQVDLAQQQIILTATPRASVKEEKGDMEGHGQRRTVSTQGKSWCFEDISWGGDEGWVGLCVEPGEGFTSGQWGWAGGSSQEANFTAKRAK